MFSFYTSSICVSPPPGVDGSILPGDAAAVAAPPTGVTAAAPPPPPALLVPGT